jgi:hypothetical protein
MQGASPAEKVQVAMLNMNSEQAQSAATGAVATSQDSTVKPSVSALDKATFTVNGVTNT